MGRETSAHIRPCLLYTSAIPLEHIVVETDCPYLAPTPHRGKRNSSAYLPLVIEEIAKLKEITAEEVENATYENAQRLYGLIR